MKIWKLRTNSELFWNFHKVLLFSKIVIPNIDHILYLYLYHYFPDIVAMEDIINVFEFETMEAIFFTICFVLVFDWNSATNVIFISCGSAHLSVLQVWNMFSVIHANIFIIYKIKGKLNCVCNNCHIHLLWVGQGF